MAMSSLVAQQVYGSRGPLGSQPPDDQERSAAEINSLGATPVTFWLVLIGLLVAARLIWEWAEES